MNKIWIAVAVGLVCASAQAQDSRYDRRSDSRYERSTDPRYERGADPRYERGADSRYERGADSRYERSAESRQERSINACVNDYARGEKLSRKEMRKLEDKCSGASARAPIRPSEQQADRRRYSPSMPDGSLQGRNLRGVPDTSGPP